MLSLNATLTTLPNAHPSLKGAFADMVSMTSHLAPVDAVVMPDGTNFARVTAEGDDHDMREIAESWERLGTYPGMFSTIVLVPTMFGEVMN